MIALRLTLACCLALGTLQPASAAVAASAQAARAGFGAQGVGAAGSAFTAPSAASLAPLSGASLSALPALPSGLMPAPSLNGLVGALNAPVALSGQSGVVSAPAFNNAAAANTAAVPSSLGQNGSVSAAASAQGRAPSASVNGGNNAAAAPSSLSSYIRTLSGEQNAAAKAPVAEKLQALEARSGKGKKASADDLTAAYDGAAAERAKAAVDANIAALQADIAHRTSLVRPGDRKGTRIAVVAAARLPQGKFPSSFSKADTAKELGTKVVRGLLTSAGLSVDALKEMADKGNEVKFLFGAVDSSESPDIAREIAVSLGLTFIPGSGIAKNCGTSLEAVAMGVNALIAGTADVVVAGGAESMSRLPLMTKDPVLQKQFLTLAVLPSMFKGSGVLKKGILAAVYAKTWVAHKWRLATTHHRFAITEGLTIDGDMMADTAQRLADKYGISRVDMDWFAYASQNRAETATREGRFADQIVPYEGKRGVEKVDQGIRFAQSRSGFASRKIQPVFGTKDITAANASQISDGAAGVLLMTEEKAREMGLVPMAYISAVADTAGDPKEMGIQPAYAIPKALKKAGVALSQVEAFEINEAFAAQTVAVMKGLNLPLEKVNQNGGAIALGHPLAASGARTLTTLIYNMMHHGLLKAVVALCIGGGEGIAAVVERDPSGIPASYIAEIKKGLSARGVSEAVLADIERTLNGLPPLSQNRPETARLLAFLNSAASGSDSAAAVFSPELFDRYTDAARGWVAEAVQSPVEFARMGETISSFYPGFKDRFEAEFGQTYSFNEAAARLVAIHAYQEAVKRGEAGPLPASLTAFERGENEGGSSSTPAEYLYNALRRNSGVKPEFFSVWDSELKALKPTAPAKAPAVAKALNDSVNKRILRVAADLAVFSENPAHRTRLDKRGAVFFADGAYNHLKVTRMADTGVAVVAIGRAPVNAINEALILELDHAFSSLSRDKKVKSIVFTGEGRAFMAGADINLIQSSKTPAEAAEKAAALQRFLDQVEASQKPVIMALNGQTLGGGSEFAIAAHERWAAGTAEIGQPEVKLLFNPGAGGTQRLVRLVGLTAGLTAMNSGQSYDAHTAKTMGWIDQVTPPAELLTAVIERARELAALPEADRASWLKKHRTLKRRVKLTIMERVGMLFNGYFIRRMVSAETRKLGKEIALPAMMGIIDATLYGIKKGPAAGLKKEVEIFGRLATTPGSKFVQRLFLRSTGGPKIEGVTDGSVTAKPIRKVAVVGAGAMGAGIAQLAAYSDIPVVLKDVAPKGLAAGLAKIKALFDGLVEKMKFSPEQAAKKNSLVEGLTDDLAFNQRGADLVIEAVVENLDLKKRLFAQWGKELPADTILASNTSALSVTELALASGRPGKVVGLHYFNPPHKLPLVELIVPNRKKLTAEQAEELRGTIASVMAYMKKTGRIVVVSEDAPGFIVNRMLVSYINEALRLIEEGATIAQIDKVMKKLGTPMGPLELADHVGFFLAIEVGSYLERSLPHMERMSVLPKVLKRWGHEGAHWGEKKGFYTDGKPNEQIVREAAAVARAIEASGEAQPGLDTQIDELTEMKAELVKARKPRKFSDREIEERLRYRMANEGARIVHEGTAASADDVDIALTAGTGYPPPTGGLMYSVAAEGAEGQARMRGYAESVGDRYEPSQHWENAAK